MLKAGLLALALALPAGAAWAAPMFDDFQGLCVKTAADPAATVAAATAGGWSPVPAPLLAQFSGAAGVQDADGRMRSDANGLSFVLVGHKQLPVGGATLSVRFCAVATTAAPPAGQLPDALSAWAAVPAAASMSKPGQTGYFFLDDAGGHKPVPMDDPAAAMAMAKSGHLRLAFVQESKSIHMLAFAIPFDVSPAT
ncbi:hypothetical protein [Phenylobacterium sp.]|uniref:hypothetical protein n=1 Tax=Phenylobacterium sp. TaxID=1871053 RepID=UPI0012016751|nr:hypothetical protein [Phenylobacterium sp.]THD57751.1 MAG: hypothetical protein E8A49_21320 [Phenylobacterium sp.]